MTIGEADQRALDVLDARLRTVLPAEYQDAYENVQPVSMGSAGLKYGDDGNVAWDRIWGTFCDLAMAGGPPHKGALLEPASVAQVDARPQQYRDVVDEIRRGVTMVTDMRAVVSPVPGWIRVHCHGETMAGWLLRAVVMENVMARAERDCLDLPAAPGFRLEKEIKNVITVIAKTCHYWLGHIPRAQQEAVAALFAVLEAESPLIVPGAASGDDGVRSAAVERIERVSGRAASPHRYAGWMGVECASVRRAVWMMRAMVVSNVLARREGTVLFVPVNGETDPGGERVATVFAHVDRLASVRGVP